MCISLGVVGQESTEYVYLKSGNNREIGRVLAGKFDSSIHMRNKLLRRKEQFFIFIQVDLALWSFKRDTLIVQDVIVTSERDTMESFGVII